MTRTIRLHADNFSIQHGEEEQPNKKTLFDWVYLLWDDATSEVVTRFCIEELHTIVGGYIVEDLDAAVWANSLSAETVCDIFNRSQERMLCEYKEKCLGKGKADCENGCRREQRNTHAMQSD